MTNLKDKWLQETLGVSEKNLALKVAPAPNGSPLGDSVTDVDTSAAATHTKRPMDLARTEAITSPANSPLPATKYYPQKMSKEDIKEALLQIRLDLGSIQTSITSIWTNYDKGLDVFNLFMTDARIKELKPENLSFWNKLLKNGFDGVKDFIKGAVPGATVVVGFLDAWDPSAPTVGSGAKSVTKYVASLKSSLGKKRDDLLAKFSPNGGPLVGKYQELAGSDAAKALVCAEEIAAAVKGFEVMRIKQDTRFFKQQFASEFATKGGAARDGDNNAKDDGKGKGREEDGTLYFRVYLHMEGDAKKHRFKRIGASPKWKLVRKGSKAEAEGVAEALQDAYNQPWLANVPKKVAIHITSDPGEAKKGMGGNYQHSGWLTFGTDDSGKVVGVEDVKGQKELLKEAWTVSEVSDWVKGNSEIEGATE